jgi:hypothetical protein
MLLVAVRRAGIRRRWRARPCSRSTRPNRESRDRPRDLRWRRSARAALDHLRQHGRHRVQRAEQIHREHLQSDLYVERARQRGLALPGVRDEHVDAPKLRTTFATADFTAPRRARQPRRRARAPRGLNLSRDFAQNFRAPRQQPDRRPAPPELHGQRLADAARRARDQDCLSRPVHFECPTPQQSSATCSPSTLSARPRSSCLIKR